MVARSQRYKREARLFYEAAKAADRVIGLLPGYEIAAPAPVMANCAHSIELSLKAFLLESGLGESAVRELNHDLEACWKECQEVATRVGVQLPTIDVHVLAVISDLHVGRSLHYGEPSRLRRLPVFGPLSQLVEQLLALVDAPALSDFEEAS